MNTPLEKNGRDAAQDRTVAELDAKNTADHARLTELIHDLKLSVSLDVEKMSGMVKAHRLVAMAVWAILGLSVVVTGSMVNRGIDFLDHLSTQVHGNTTHFKEFQAIGIEWGDNLDDRDKEIKEDIRQLRRLINEHRKE
jgi:hypothetical protein